VNSLSQLPKKDERLKSGEKMSGNPSEHQAGAASMAGIGEGRKPARNKVPSIKEAMSPKSKSRKKSSKRNHQEVNKKMDSNYRREQ